MQRICRLERHCWQRQRQRQRHERLAREKQISWSRRGLAAERWRMWEKVGRRRRQVGERWRDRGCREVWKCREEVAG